MKPTELDALPYPWQVHTVAEEQQSQPKSLTLLKRGYHNLHMRLTDEFLARVARVILECDQSARLQFDHFLLDDYPPVSCSLHDLLGGLAFGNKRVAHGYRLLVLDTESSAI